jgi:hypothetical protein
MGDIFIEKKNVLKKVKSLDVYVVRVNNLLELGDSAPCIDCYNTLLKYNVRNLIYSCDNGEFTKVRIKDYKPKIKSLGRKFIDAGYNKIIVPKKEQVKEQKNYNIINNRYANMNKYKLVNEKHKKYITFDSYIHSVNKLTKRMETERENERGKFDDCNKSNNSSILSNDNNNPKI